MPCETLKISEHNDGAVLEIALNTPPGNVLTAKMMAEIESQLEIEEKERARKLIIFTGAGDHFSFGASVEEHQRDQVGAMLPAFHRLMGKVLAHPTPMLAKVSGQCLGGGFELALACSFIIASEDARFAVPEISLGVFPPVAALLLPRLVGPMRANRMVLTGAKSSAEDMHCAGLVIGVSKKGDLDDDTTAFIEKYILPKSASSLRFAQRAARASLMRHYEAHIGELERLYLNELMSSHDANEGIAAFLEKRAMEWTNS
ncbi:MAG: enoyl-CoA hydratase/isomerase family protein [Parvularculaceae bacterium]